MIVNVVVDDLDLEEMAHTLANWDYICPVEFG